MKKGGRQEAAGRRWCLKIQSWGLVCLLVVCSCCITTSNAQTASSSSQAPTVPAKGTSLPATTQESDIRDIRGPLHIPYPWLWVVYVIGGMLVTALLVMGYRSWRRRPKAVIRLPHEIALEQLQQAMSLMTPGQAREFSIAVSDAVRLYIEERFQVHAARRTTEEFLRDLFSDPSSVLSNYSASLEDFLKHCDLAKFGRWTLSVSEMQSMHASARRFVEETQPMDETRNGGRATRNGGATPGTLQNKSTMVAVTSQNRSLKGV